MYLPPLQMPVTLDRLIRGDVQVDSSAAIAPGVILQADPGSSILIGAGVCIGMGAIIHAQDGKLEIGAGTNLGAGVLIVGQSEVGINCSIGSCVTIVNCNLESGSIVAAGMILDSQGLETRNSTEKFATENSANPQSNSEAISDQDQTNLKTNLEADPENDSIADRGDTSASKSETEVSPSSAIALNHAKAHLSKFMSKIKLA